MIQLTYTGQFLPQLPEKHRFPIAKYSLIREQLLYEGALQPEQLQDPGLCPDEAILLVHDALYWQQAKQLQLPPKAVRALGLPLVKETVLRAQNSVHCTLVSTQHALDRGIGIHLGGGTHHAFSDRPEGFCLLNDLAVAAAWLVKVKKLSRVLIVDLDVHQGNGTAHIFSAQPEVFTFSLHCQQNYPLRKEASNWDIALPAGTTDSDYLQALEPVLDELIDRAQPQLVLYQAGVDVLEGDLLGKFLLSKAACLVRDRMVLEACHKNKIPLVITLGGGYHGSLPELVEAHSSTVRAALSIYS